MRGAERARVLQEQVVVDVEGLAEEPLIITRHGQPIAVVLTTPEDPEDLDSFLIAHDPRFQEMIRKSKQSKLISSGEAASVIAATSCNANRPTSVPNSCSGR